MMKSLVLPLLAAALVLGGAGAAHAQQLKLGTVDMKKVFENYYKTKDAEQRINEARNTAKKELEDRMDTYKKLTEEVKKLNDDIAAARAEQGGEGSSAASSATRRSTSCKNMEREIREFQASRRSSSQEQTVRMRGGIVDEINKVVKDRVKAEQFDLVLDRSGQSLNGVPIVLYARDSYDFTDGRDHRAEQEPERDRRPPDAAAPAATPARARRRRPRRRRSRKRLRHSRAAVELTVQNWPPWWAASWRPGPMSGSRSAAPRPSRRRWRATSPFSAMRSICRR